MSRLVSLTRPISERSSTGTLLPWERPYTTEPIATLSHNGANLFHIDMSPSASTRVLSLRIADPEQPALRELDPALFLNRRADVVRIPGREGRQITGSELSDALSALPADGARALVLLTGWGESSSDEGEAYLQGAPYLAADAVDTLCRTLDARAIDLLLTDLPYLTAPSASNAGNDWLGVPPWFRPSWPSSSATKYLAHHYAKERALEDWAPTVGVLKRACLVLGLAGTAGLPGARAVVNVAPFQVRDVGEAPCTVVAEPVDD